MSECNAHWCRTLGNYASGTRTMRGAAPRFAHAPTPQRITPMAFKPPRTPNPNLALLQRQQVLAASHARAGPLVRTQTLRDDACADVTASGLLDAAAGHARGAARNPD